MTKKKSWFVYMIRTEKDRLYTGIAVDVERRFEEHFGLRKGGAKFFRSDKPSAIVYVEICKDRSQASIREAAIKKMSRLQKETLLKGDEVLSLINHLPRYQ